MADTCRLCLNTRCEPPWWDRPLFESPNFSVLPSLGALVEGWLLVVPRAHFICLGALEPSLIREFNWIKQLAVTALTECYGPLAAFEHGPSGPRNAIGCGVDHAHLHVVPTSEELLPGVRSYLPECIRWEVGTIGTAESHYRENRSYLYVEQPIGVGLIATQPAFGSQLFRRVIADSIGKPLEYNWREFPHEENVARTIERVSHWARNHYSKTASLLTV
jgi:ATP adenylyltransferase